MKKLYNRTALFHARAIVGLFALCLLALPSPALAQAIDLKLTNVTVKEAIEALNQRENYSVAIKSAGVDMQRRVSISAQNASIDEVLAQIFADQDISYTITGKSISVTKAAPKSLAADKNQLKGVVKDNLGLPVPGATIIVDGTNNGTTTMSNGDFSLENVKLPAKLVISFIGYQPRTVEVNSYAAIDITLVESSAAIDEVVVVGYGTQRRSLVTNAISQFKPTEENMRSVMSPSELLQGRIAGVSISTSSGNLGSAEKMSIRGSSSLSASNEPLYVIDGIPLSNNSASLYSFGENMSSLATLNLTDIESIEVLKDAASAAIYGSRATNGVVLITTKQGREGKSEVKVNYGFSITQFPNTGRREYVGSKQYVEVFNEGVDNYNRQNGFTVNSSGYVKPIRNPYGDMPDTDWLDLITRLGQSHYLDLSFSGGNAKTKYYLSGSYNYQEGVIKTNDISKVNLKSNINHEMFKWLKVGANISGNYLHNNRIPGANLGSTIIGRAVQQRPFDRPYKPNGGYYTGGTDELLLHNAVQILSLIHI